MPRPPAWLLAGVTGMLCVALSSGFAPWAAAIAGAIVPADLAADAAAARLFVERISPYGPVIRTVHMNITGLPYEATLPYFPHPPFSLIVGLPMAFISFHAAALLWFAVSIGLVFILAVLIHSAASESANATTPGVGALFLLLLAWPPVLYNLEKGQWSIMVAVLLAVAWRTISRGDVRQGAVWAGVAASVKVFPVVLGAYFLMRSFRATLLFAATGLILLTVPLAWIGPGALAGFIGESRLNLPYWETFPLVTFSVHGAISRALIGGQWAEPFVVAPIAARVIEACAVAGLLGLAVWATMQAKRGRADHALALLAWLVLLPMLNPLGLGHNGVLLALPITVLSRALMSHGRLSQCWGWSLAVTLISVPKQTIWRFAAPPAGALDGVAVAALPMWGALLLFLVTVSLAVRTHAGARSLQAVRLVN